MITVFLTLVFIFVIISIPSWLPIAIYVVEILCALLLTVFDFAMRPIEPVVCFLFFGRFK